MHGLGRGAFTRDTVERRKEARNASARVQHRQYCTTYIPVHYTDILTDVLKPDVSNCILCNFAYST
jgi:hypothetical protein